MVISVEDIESFEWDAGNVIKSRTKHGVTPAEAEQVFFNEPLVLLPDEKHSERETRFFALGHTNDGRRLFVAFTVRGRKIRVISCREMSRKERAIYDEA